MIFDLHTHTKQSFDAFTSEKELLRACVVKGIDVIGVTEHDRPARVDFENFKKNGIIVLSGCEFTTDMGAHIIGFFGRSIAVENKVRSKRETLEYIKELNGIAVMPHPLKENTGYLAVYGEDDDIKDFDFIELVNGGNLKNSMNEILEDISIRYDIKPLSSSDSHSAEQVGMCVTRIAVENILDDDAQALNTLKTVTKSNISLLIDSAINLKQREEPKYKNLKMYQFILTLIPHSVRRTLKIYKNYMNFSRLKIRPPLWINVHEFNDFKKNT